MTHGRYILTLQCPDAIGIVAATATFLADRGLSIEESGQFHEGGVFYMRTAFSKPSQEAASLAELEAGFAPIARRFKMEWRIHDTAVRSRIVIAVSQAPHCLYDLFHRQEMGGIDADICAVVSNHETMREFAAFRKTPFYHVPVTPESKPAAEARMLQIMEAEGAELLVLARYMQILTVETCAKLAGRCINIHHSFLPSFKGASPYHQAHRRGVKIIGATAHYVTPDLDEGPIIEQATARIAHHHTPQDLIGIGRDLECQVLGRAVRWHLERRVVIAGNKTVVFV
ncbi:MAG: formyltetrahydrofolate deformylase [Hyphomonadaceae bacterium]|nr:formyltetrahydrofolate deformylase [Hyphomonadaceae bacterium]